MSETEKIIIRDSDPDFHDALADMEMGGTKLYRDYKYWEYLFVLRDADGEFMLLQESEERPSMKMHLLHFYQSAKNLLINALPAIIALALVLGTAYQCTATFME